MMQIHIIYFAALRDVMGCRDEYIECEEGTTIAELLNILQERYPQLDGLIERLAFAIDHTYAKKEMPLHDNAELALLPPVAGGNIKPEEEGYQLGKIEVRHEPFEAEEVNQLVKGEFGGAIITFTGIVRRESKGRIVTNLTYESYEEMARKEMAKIAEEIKSEWPSIDLAIHHRVGSLSVGDIAVVIAVCSPHRKEGFDACAQALESVKDRVPVWKRESFEDGSHWVGWGV